MANHCIHHKSLPHYKKNNQNDQQESSINPYSNDSNNDDDEDDPKLSSAALCISMTILGDDSFRPEFTHQCFEDEWIRGYQPFLQVLEEQQQYRQQQKGKGMNNQPKKQQPTNGTITTRNNTTTNNNDSYLLDGAKRGGSSHSQANNKSQQQQQQQQELCKSLLHESHRNHSTMMTRELKICVELAPSGQSCSIQLYIRDNNNNDNSNAHHHHRTSERVATTKKRRRCCHASSKRNKDDDDDSSTEYDEEEDEYEEDSDVDDSDRHQQQQERRRWVVVDASGPTRRRRMPVKDILERLQKALPTIVATTTHNDPDNHDDNDGDDDNSSDNDGNNKKRKRNVARHINGLAKNSNVVVGDNYLKQPMGNILEEYKHNSIEFVICLAKGKDVIDFHHNVQRLALFFIENASDVDLASEDGEHWRILYLLRKHRMKTPKNTSNKNNNGKNHTKNKKRQQPQKPKEIIQYSIVGYLTLFYFSAPFRKPKPGIVARICQVLILPPYQRAGHGKRLLHCVHDLAHGKYEEDDNNIVEINVEDPAPGFVALRNMVDYERLVQSKNDGRPWLPQLHRDPTRVSRTTFAPLTDEQANQAAILAKITPHQVNVCYEIYQLQVLREILLHDVTNGNASSDNNKNLTSSLLKDDLEKSYRLMVKKRLSKTHKEELGRGWNKKEMQNQLTQLFDDVFRQYHSILGISMKK